MVVLGATGYTGRLVCEYLARLDFGSVGRWAIAGRNEEKLNLLKEELAVDVPVLVADFNSVESLDKICGSTNLLVSCAGPFTQVGMPVVEACLRCRTHYVDSTGEYGFVRQVIERFHEKAIEQGVLFVPCCAFDSVPADLGNYVVHDGLGARVAGVKACYQLRSCGVSGGTARSVLALLESTTPEDEDPHSLSPKDAPRPSAAPSQRGVWYDFSERKLTGPFVMAPTNERVVRRTNALLGYDSSYVEVLGGSVGDVVGTTLMTFAKTVFLKVPFLRRFAAKYLIPPPGTGPTQTQKELSWYKCVFTAVDRSGKKLRRVWLSDNRDMYTASGLYIAEGALSALQMMKEGSLRPGVLTPMVAFGDVLRQRVQQAGVVIEVVDETATSPTDSKKEL